MKLHTIHQSLKAPKGQTNAFGKYKYRSCSDILEALKPVLAETKCHIIITDSIVLVGDRYYVKADVALIDSDSNERIAISSSFARESLIKKGMDESQITGAASSYARKYALNGLFCIDDTEDADTKDNSDSPPNTEKIAPIAGEIPQPTPKELAILDAISDGLFDSAPDGKFVSIKKLGDAMYAQKGAYPNDEKKVSVLIAYFARFVKEGKMCIETEGSK